MTDALNRFAAWVYPLAKGVLMLWAVATVVTLGWYAMDREPPFHIIRVYPATVRPGEYVTITAEVQRELGRKCAATMSRYIFERGYSVRYDIGTSYFSAATIERIEQASPGILSIRVFVPPQVRPGPAHLVSVLEYECNKLHAFWPIEVELDFPFEVVP